MDESFLKQKLFEQIGDNDVVPFNTSSKMAPGNAGKLPTPIQVKFWCFIFASMVVEIEPKVC